MSFLMLFLKGILIGIAMVIPGVSGGVIAVVFGIYEKMISSLTNLFKDFKKNFTYLFVLGIGILCGLIFFSNIILYFYECHEAITKSLFIGLILGGVPYLFSEISRKDGSKANYQILALTFILSAILFLVSKKAIRLNVSSLTQISIKNLILLFIAGYSYSVGKVIPGISGSFILIVFGMYEYVLKLTANPLKIGVSDIYIIIPFIFGFLVGMVFFLKLINYLLEKHFKNVYSMIIGFVLGSTIALIPMISSFSEALVSIIVLAGSFIFSYKFIK